MRNIASLRERCENESSMSDRRAPSNSILATVYYQGLLYRIVRKREESLSLSKESTLGSLIDSLVERYGEEFARALLTPAAALRPDVGVLVNGLNPARRGGLSYPLGEDDSCAVEIALLGSPPAGG